MPRGSQSLRVGRSAALIFLQIFPIFAAKTALQPIPIRAPRIHEA